MIAIGIDPGCSRCGIAIADDGVVLGCRAVAMTGDTWAAANRALVPAAQALVALLNGPGPIRAAVERAPDTARQDAGRRGAAQGRIAWSQGFAAAAALHAVHVAIYEPATGLALEAEPAIVQPPEWRAVMLADAVRCRLLMQAPRRQNAEQMRDWWKAAACRWFARRYADQWADLIRGPRERCRSEKFDHELAGVADACEAAGVAVWGSRVRTPGRL